MTLPIWLFLGAASFSVIAVFLYPRVRRQWQERNVSRALLELGIQCRHRVILRDVLEEGAYLDYLILMPDRIVLLDVKRYRGNIFAAWNMDMWTQVVGRRSFKFPNPLHKLDADVAILKSIAPEVNVEGHIAFAGDSRFARGVPVGVMLLQDVLTRYQIDRETPVDNTVRIGWERLSQYLANESTR